MVLLLLSARLLLLLLHLSWPKRAKRDETNRKETGANNQPRIQCA